MHLRRAFLRVCSRIGIEGVTFHTMRHTFASHLLKSGVDIKTVSKLRGRKNIETTMIYLHTDLPTMRAGIERLDFSPEKAVGTKSAQNQKARTRKSGLIYN